MGPTIVYRTAVARVLAWSFAVLTILALVYFAVTGGLRELIASGGVAVFVGAVAWALFALPAVTVSDGGVTVRNVLRTVHVPWPVFRGVETAWALTVRTSEGDVESWAIPAASGLAARGALAPPRRLRDRARSGTGTAGRGVNAAVVALAIGERHRALADAGWLTGDTLQSVRPERRWNRDALLLLGAAGALALAGILLR